MNACAMMYFGGFIEITKIEQFDDGTNVISFNEKDNKIISLSSIGRVDKVIALYERIYCYATSNLVKWELIGTRHTNEKIEKISNPISDFLFIISERVDEKLRYWITDMQDWYEPLSVKRLTDNGWPYKIYYTLRKTDTPQIAKAISIVYNEIVEQMKLDYKSYFDRKK